MGTLRRTAFLTVSTIKELNVYEDATRESPMHLPSIRGDRVITETALGDIPFIRFGRKRAQV